MPDNTIFIDFGSFAVYWYGVFTGGAVFLAALLFGLMRKLQKESFTSALLVALLSMPVAFITGRTFYCWFAKASFDGLRDCLRFTSGGYALYGALLGVLMVLIAGSCLYRTSLLRLCDAAVPALSLAIAAGRLAGITSNDSIGFAVSSEWLRKLPFVIWSASEQEWILWVGFFEGIIALLMCGLTLAIFLLTYRGKQKNYTCGSATLIFMLIYGLSQSILESMRNDSLFMVTLGFVRISQIISIVMAVAGMIIIIVKNCRLHKPPIRNIVLWLVCAAALGIAIYCEFEMNALAMVRNYVMMGISLSTMLAVALLTFFENVKLPVPESSALAAATSPTVPTFAAQKGGHTVDTHTAAPKVKKRIKTDFVYNSDWIQEGDNASSGSEVDPIPSWLADAQIEQPVVVPTQLSSKPAVTQAKPIPSAAPATTPPTAPATAPARSSRFHARTRGAAASSSQQHPPGTNRPNATADFRSRRVNLP